LIPNPKQQIADYALVNPPDYLDLVALRYAISVPPQTRGLAEYRRLLDAALKVLYTGSVSLAAPHRGGP